MQFGGGRERAACKIKNGKKAGGRGGDNVQTIERARKKKTGGLVENGTCIGGGLGGGGWGYRAKTKTREKKKWFKGLRGTVIVVRSESTKKKNKSLERKL